MTDAVKVFHLIETLGPGGAEHLLLTTVRALDRNKVVSSVGCLFPPLDLKPQFEDAGVPVYPMSLRGRLDWFRGVIALARLLRRIRPDVVHTHLFYANFYGRLAARLAGCPAVVTTLHSLDYTYQDNGRLSFRVKKIADRLTARYLTTAHVAVSEAVRDDFRRHLGLTETDVIHNFVDPRAHAALAPEERRAVRTTIGCSDKEFVLLNVGRLHREKGQQFVIVAMQQIVQAVPTARLVLAGDGPDEGELRALAAAHGVAHAVVFAGRRSDIRTLLAGADVFILPSNLEGLPIALLEAMATALPVVATRVGGIPEVVDEGVNGRLVPAGDSAGIADVVIEIYARPDQSQRMGRNARLTVEERFSVSAAMHRLETLYQGLARSQARLAA